MPPTNEEKVLIMKKIYAALLAALSFIISSVSVFADTAGGPDQGIIHIDGVPGWVWRVVILLILLYLAILPMKEDLKEYLKIKRSMRRMGRK